MSIFDPDLYGRTKHDVAVERIRTFCAGRKTLVAFSGGKDSQCCYHLAEEAGVPFTAQYSITRFEPPELLRFIRENYPDVTLRRAYNRSLVETIQNWGLPTRWARWCCEAKHRKTEGFDIEVVGVRAEESARRAANWRLFGYKRDKTAYVCPVIDWTTEDVWEYLAHLGKPHCCLYDPPWNFRRIGCVCCPLAPKDMRRHSELWPKTAAMLFCGHIKNWERMVSLGGKTPRGKPCRMLEFDSPRASFEHWLDTGMTIPEKSDADETQCLFAGTGFSESDGAGETI